MNIKIKAEDPATIKCPTQSQNIHNNYVNSMNYKDL